MKIACGIILSLLAATSFAARSPGLCDVKPVIDEDAYRATTAFISDHPVKTNQISGQSTKEQQTIVTGENEYTTITYNSPYPVQFEVFPQTEIEILNVGDEKCGPQIKINKGKVLSSGEHPATTECAFEIETDEAYIIPTGTSYLVETGALNDAIAELNGETSGEGTEERYSVKKGSIQIKLKRVSKNKLRNKIKYAKEDKKKNSKRGIAKSSKDKTTTRFLAYNERIKLNAGSSLKVKRKKSLKKTQTADLEILEPAGM